MASNYQISGLGNQLVELDPSATGNIIRYAMIFESIANLPFTAALLFFPERSLTYFLVHGSDNTPAARGFAQLISITTLMISVLLWAAIPNTRSGIETRRPAYYMLTVAEASMMSLWAYQVYVLGEEGSGWKRSGLEMAILNIAPLCGFRLFALFVKPNWFGRYRIKAKTK